MAQNGVDIVLNGHDHNYQRWVPLDGAGHPSPGGITEFVAGAGGHSIQAFVTPVPSEKRVAFGVDTSPTAYGALRLELFPASFNFNYINTSGTVLDNGAFTCSGASRVFLPLK